MKRAILKPGKEKRVYSRHPWVFDSDIEYVEGSVNPGDIVDISNNHGRFLARGFYNPKSKIALRIMTYHEEMIDKNFITRRIHDAIDFRRSFADLQSCRMIFAESDRLPALIVDAFGDVLVLQCLALGMERYKQIVVEALIDELHPIGIWERSDAPVRSLEGLGAVNGLLYGVVPDKVLMKENGILFHVDVKGGQKTGYFLDQKENRAAIKPFVKDKTVLDCFTHTGSFAIHAGYYGAADVTGVDISEYACSFAEENSRLNDLQGIVHFQAVNAFDLLSEKSRKGDKYDVIILDPPAFTKSKATIRNAMRGYKEINLRAMKMIVPGGILITCSCSQHVSPAAFREMVSEAAADAHVYIKQIEFRSQGKDHPILPYAPETEYLKCVIYQMNPI